MTFTITLLMRRVKQVDFDNVDNDEQWNEESFDFLVRESTQPVFDGSKQNWLQCGIVFYSLCSLYSVPHTFMDALLTWIAGSSFSSRIK